MPYSTKEFIKKVNISEATLRRWIAEKNRIPELDTVEKDWRGWRTWDDVHIKAVLGYKKNKLKR